jgi:hypothetical protein
MDNIQKHNNLTQDFILFLPQQIFLHYKTTRVKSYGHWYSAGHVKVTPAHHAVRLEATKQHKYCRNRSLFSANKIRRSLCLRVVPLTSY